jgi:hypothetical protein
LSVDLHCGSASITHTEYPNDANAAAVEMVLLVFPQPPLPIREDDLPEAHDDGFGVLRRTGTPGKKAPPPVGCSGTPVGGRATAT